MGRPAKLTNREQESKEDARNKAAQNLGAHAPGPDPGEAEEEAPRMRPLPTVAVPSSPVVAGAIAATIAAAIVAAVSSPSPSSVLGHACEVELGRIRTVEATPPAPRPRVSVNVLCRHRWGWLGYSLVHENLWRASLPRTSLAGSRLGAGRSQVGLGPVGLVRPCPCEVRQVETGGGQVRHAKGEARRLRGLDLIVVMAAGGAWGRLSTRPPAQEGGHRGPVEVGEAAHDGAIRRPFLHLRPRGGLGLCLGLLSRELPLQVGVLTLLLPPQEVLPRRSKDVHVWLRGGEAE